jgi:methylated-DNA-[protein]-cysteine S-methyltransferase
MAESIRFWIDRIMTPIGELTLAADEAGALRSVDWTEHTDRTERLLRLQYGLRLMLEPRRDPYSLTTALRAYFAGELAIIDELPVATSGTIFQRAV